MEIIENGLIPIYQDAQRRIVNARELHEFLGVGKDFSNWIKDRIEKYGFVEDEDFAIFDSPNLANQTGRGGDRRSKDYLLTIDTAKEIAMAENSEKGRTVRRYFIACEKKLKETYDLRLPRDLPAALRALADAEEQKLVLQAKAEADRPKVLFAESVETSRTSILVGDLAKLLKQNGVDVGQNRLFEQLRN